MSNKTIIQNTNEKYIAEIKTLLLKKEVLAQLLQYAVPEYHKLSFEEAMEKIKKVTPCQKGEYESFLESTIDGKKALFIIGVGYGDEKEPDNSTDKCSECMCPFCEVNEARGLIKPELIHMIQLCPDALDHLIGHDRNGTLVAVSLNQKEPIKLRYEKSSPLDLTFIYFNQTAKLTGVHRILQIIFSDTNKEELLKKEFGI